MGARLKLQNPRSYSEVAIFMQGRNSFKIGNNTILERSPNGFRVTLHGNQIVEYREREVYLTCAGWNTVTTRARLNALTPCGRIYSKDFQPRFHLGLLDFGFDSDSQIKIKWHDWEITEVK